MRGVNGGSRAVNSTLNAAASAIISADTRAQHSTQKRKESSFWSMCWCFGSHKYNKRIGHALSNSDRSEQPAASASENYTQGRMVVLPFAAPPSSPVSFYPSEPPSAIHSPVNIFSVSSGMYSPSGPANIFAVGPYANEPQLVSPPAFSNFTTEPSTAPVTPPPEYIHLTTPSSPEVPFARLLDPTNNNNEVSQAYPLSQYEFQGYQYCPGSPFRQLMSPRSGISTPPYLVSEHAVCSHSLKFPSTGRPKFLSMDKKPTQDWGSRSGSLTPDSTMSFRKPDRDRGSRIGSGSLTPESTKAAQDWGSRIGSGSLTPDTASRNSRQSCILDLENYIKSHAQNIGKSAQKLEGHVQIRPVVSNNEIRNVDPIADHRVSFELSAMDVLKCVQRKQAAWTPSPIPATLVQNATTAVESTPQRRSLSSALGSGNEFNFDNEKIVVEENKPNISPDWWANEKIVVEEGELSKGWPFFSSDLNHPKQLTRNISSAQPQLFS